MNKYTLATQKTLAELCVQKEEELKDLKDAVMKLDPESIFAFSDSELNCIYCGDWNARHSENCPVVNLRRVLNKLGGESCIT